MRPSRAALPVAASLALCLGFTLAMAGEIQPYNQTRFDDLTAHGKPVLLEVHANWCPTCRAQKPLIAELMAEPAYKDVTTLVIDFDADKAVLRHYRVNMQSTLIAYRGEKEVGRSVGDTRREGIEALIKKTVQ